MQKTFTGKVALVGMMASGKTTVGRELARLLSVPFADADDAIVAAAGMPIADCFALRGEAVFRELERAAVERLLGGDGGLVLSLGGGAFIQPEIRAMLAGRARSVFLRVDAEELVRRLEATDIAARPLLASSPDWRRKIADLLAAREKPYSEADIRFNANARDPKALAHELAALLLNERGTNNE